MKCYLLYILCFVTALGNAQKSNEEYIIEYISTDEGLHHNYVSKVVSDSLNIKWIATENGLNKYDGLNFSVIKPSERYSGLINENIETLFVDSRNNLWIGTKSGGLSRLNIKTNIVFDYGKILDENIKEPLRIRHITEDNKGNIWVGSQDKGIYIIDPVKQKLIKKFKINKSKSILKDVEDNMWVATLNKLNKYNEAFDLVFSVTLDRNITNMIEDRSRNCLWISTINTSKKDTIILHKLDLEAKKLSSLTTNIFGNYVSTLFLDTYDRLWFGTWGSGLYYSNRDLSAFYCKDLAVSSKKNIGVSYDIILDIHADKNNIIWVSTNYGGIVKLSEGKGFRNVERVLTNPILKNKLNIHSIYRDAGGIYLGTLKNGLFTGKDFSSLSQLKITQNEKIFSIHKLDNALAIGTSSYAIFLDENKKEISRLNIAKATSFLTKNKNRLWVGTQNSGLYYLDVSELSKPKIINHFTILGDANSIDSNRIAKIALDARNNMWIATYNGLHLYDVVSKSFVNYNKRIRDLPIIINTIFTDSKFIWLGTPNGLYKLIFKDKELKIVNSYNTEDGLNNEFICEITSDIQNNLWISTLTNLVRFDQIKNSFINYGKGDGVSTSVFNLRSMHKSEFDETILAGGIGDLTYFDSESIRNSEYLKELIITHLKIGNKIVQPQDSINGKLFLTKDISYTKELTFSHHEKAFSIGFITNDFADNETTNYKYRLLGLEDRWNYLKNQNEVNFVGLPPGSYQLEISSSNDFKNWLLPKKIAITVLHAPLTSPLAIVIYSLLFMMVLSALLIFYLKQNNLKVKLKLSRIEQEKEHDLNEAKFTFFTNISHEFRTPLTLILGPIKDILRFKDLNAEISEKLIPIEKSADRLLNLTNQLLDFRKAEHGVLKINAVQGNFVRFSNEIFMYFKEQAAAKNIIYSFKSFEDAIEFPFDRNKMEIVLSNLISNAFKNTKLGGNIKMVIKLVNGECVISIIDNGIGIEPEYQEKIFDRYYQIKNTNTAQFIGSGIGLSFSKTIVELHGGTIEVKSDLNENTEFLIVLPLPNQNVNSTQIQNQTQNSDNIVNYKKLTHGDVLANLNIDHQENTILIIDDNQDIRVYLRSVLQNDYSILEANDGEEGAAMAIEKTPDLILCDIMMPIKDGLTVCKELKANIATSHIPIIMLTARSSNLYEIEGLNTGADDFISKPFDPQIVKARIFSALQNRFKLRKYFLNQVRFEPLTNELDLNDPEGAFLNKAISLVEQNLEDESFGIQSMIDELFMSQSTLYRKIKSLTGLSITVFIRSIRLKKAAEIILTEDHKLSYVSEAVGFNDSKYFRESFKKQFGCLPSQYKQTFTNKTK